MAEDSDHKTDTPKEEPKAALPFILDVVGFAMNPVGTLAGMAAEKLTSPGMRGISPQSVLLAQRYGQLQDTESRNGLKECAMLIGVNTITGASGDCTLNAKDVAEDGLGVAKGALLRKFGPAAVISSIFDAASDARNLEKNHKDVIALMAQKKIPGFAHQQNELGKVWVDATGEKPKSYVDLNLPQDFEERQSFESWNRAEIKNMVDTTTKIATDSVRDYTAQNGAQAMKQKMTALADGELASIVRPQMLATEPPSNTFEQSKQM